MRKTKDSLVYEEISPMLCSWETDPESLAVIMSREDLVMRITYIDGSILTQHADGTIMRISKEGDRIEVRHKLYAPTIIRYDKIKARQPTIIGLGSNSSALGAND